MSSSIAQWLNDLPPDQAHTALQRCCGSSRWVQDMLARRPFTDDAHVFAAAEQVWSQVEPTDVLEALSHHPEIGADLDALRARFASTASWSSDEQAGAAEADEATLLALRDLNRRYKERFGHIFVVCATGKTAAQMLALLRERIDNEPDPELQIAAAEQAKITRLRLEKLVP